MFYQAHKGVSTENPENTMPAFVAAIEQGYDIIELDVAPTRDLRFVLIHDAKLNRTGRNPDGSELTEEIKITDITYEEFKAAIDNYVWVAERAEDLLNAQLTASVYQEIQDQVAEMEKLGGIANLSKRQSRLTDFAAYIEANATYIGMFTEDQRAVYNACLAKIEAIAAIEGLKIKANSSAKKGSITVKWTVSEEVEGVKYQVYKSTKAQKGYKKAITTSKTSFKNTKNLEKGTRYYYKVRAIAEVEGVTYYSDWSNKANRIAK